MLSPIRTMFLHFPLRAWTTVLIMAVISACAYRHLKGKWEGNTITRRQGFIRWLLANYVLLLLFLTVFGRRSQEGYTVQPELFVSYKKAFLNCNETLTWQILLNIAVFIPVGFLGSLGYKRRHFPLGLLTGMVLSVSIETMQYVMQNGYCEADDLVSNTLGTIFGCLAAACLKKLTVFCDEK